MDTDSHRSGGKISREGTQSAQRKGACPNLESRKAGKEKFVPDFLSSKFKSAEADANVELPTLNSEHRSDALSKVRSSEFEVQSSMFDSRAPVVDHGCHGWARIGEKSSESGFYPCDPRNPWVDRKQASK